MKTNLQAEYSSLFSRLGYPLSKRDGFSKAQIAKAENKVGVRLPAALRDYYLVAGRERVLNHVFNRLCLPEEWELHSGKLVFMEENQTVVVWGVTATTRPTHDPSVFQAALVSGALDRWHIEHDRCSTFLKFMIHLQASYGGGLPFTASASAPDDLSSNLRREWSFGGEVNGMQAYSREGRVVCITKWKDFGAKRKSWRAFAGAASKENLTAIAGELKLQWD
jgi:hypothetical protein